MHASTVSSLQITRSPWLHGLVSSLVEPSVSQQITFWVASQPPATPSMAIRVAFELCSLNPSHSVPLACVGTVIIGWHVNLIFVMSSRGHTGPIYPGLGTRRTGPTCVLGSGTLTGSLLLEEVYSASLRESSSPESECCCHGVLCLAPASPGHPI